MKKGFTLLELIVVIIIIGVLATLGFTQYTRMVERGRTGEARTILGQIRSAQVAYYQEYGSYAAATTNLVVDVVTGCVATNFFTYASDTSSATATRCTGSGKSPQAATIYSLNLDYAGVFTATSGYY